MVIHLMHSLISTWRSEALRTKHASAKATLSMLTRSCRPLRISLMRRLIPLASDQEIQPKECCCRRTGSDNNYTFRVKRMQWQIDEPICAHDEQSQGANQVDRPAHWSHSCNFCAGVFPSERSKVLGGGRPSRSKHTADYIVIGFLIACMLFAAAKALPRRST